MNYSLFHFSRQNNSRQKSVRRKISLGYELFYQGGQKAQKEIVVHDVFGRVCRHRIFVRFDIIHCMVHDNQLFVNLTF